MDKKKKRLIKCFTVMCLWVMLMGVLYGCGANNTEKLAETDKTTEESELPEEMQSTMEPETSTKTEQLEETELSNDVIQTTIHAEETAFQQEKSLRGTYERSFDSNGGAGFEVTYSPEEDLFYASFNGSIGEEAAGTEGFLSAYTDGTDNTWEYYDNVEFEAGNYNPSFRLQYDGIDTIVVTSLDGQTFGGMQFPGFEGTYVRTAE